MLSDRRLCPVKCSKSARINPLIADGLNSMVLQNGADWRTGPPIVLKYVNLQKKSPFHKISGEFDSYPFLSFVDRESEFDSFSKQILQIVASTIIDSF